MARGTSASPLYVPAPPPADPGQLPAYLYGEFQRIQRALLQLAAGHIDTSYVEPEKPREGDIRLADGTEWDPGSGAGFYGYYGSAWVKLG